MNTLFRAARHTVGTPGLWAAGAAVIVQRLLHAALHQAPFAPTSAAEWVIRESPGPVATYAIEHLGHRAQPTLVYAFIALALVLGFALGRRPAWLLASAAFVLTLLAAYLDPLARDTAGGFASASVAGLTAFLAQTALRARLETEAPAGTESVERVDWERRRFLARVGLGVVVVAAAGTAALRSGSQSTPKGEVLARQPAVIPPDAGFSEVAGLSPRVTPTEDHFAVDIDIEDPLISRSSWRLVLDGAVATPLSLSLADLQAMPTKERLDNLACISNPVGGDMVGNSRWTGVPLDALLEMAQPGPEAVTLVAGSSDGFTDGIPLDEIRGKDALIAIGMNGELLSRSHGFPARMLFPNHYGMRAVKWLTRLELKTEDEEGYWAQRGWDRDAVVRAASRFDVPGNGDTLQSPLSCAGVAWAGMRGIQAVEVSPDGGQSWHGAQLERVLGPLSWRRWQISFDLPPGQHTLAVRAVEGTGTLQDERERGPHPSGASGYHHVRVNVADA
jgi:DMSO/TMAO reductase YedYZ molybdopterin-dependent catalytic subunit